MASTTYTVKAANEVIATKSKKSVAVEIAVAHRNDERVDVTVETQNGNVVFELAAPKKIKMSKPFTREVGVDAENVEFINGMRVAYKRTRVGFALLDANKTGEPNGSYVIWDLENKVAMGTVGDVKTTREAGRWFADEARGIRASLVAANA